MQEKVKLTTLFFSFFKLGFTAYGGPAMVAYIRKLAVEKKKWLDNEAFQESLAIVQTIPGATAIQVAGFVGLITRGILGGIISFIAFGLPAFFLMLLLSYIYVSIHNLPEIKTIFSFLQVVVISIVINALISFAKPSIKSKAETFLAFFSFTLYLLKVNPFFIIISCFLLSQIVFKDISTSKSYVSKKFNVIGILSILLVVAAGLLVLYFLDKFLFELSIVMMKIDLFAFGGGYASLPLMLHEVVDRLHWIDTKTMMAGIALGQLTPGPIVITATFIGYLLKGFLGALIATISVFTPSFVMLVLAFEISEKIKNLQVFLRAKRGLIASFSGLLLFTSLNFANSVDWSFFKLIFALISFIAIYKGLNILYILIFTVLISFAF
jgi:chromate transporter